MLFAILVLIGLVAVAVFMCMAAYNRPSETQAEAGYQVEETLDLELARIEYAKQAAKDDIRRRRQYAEDQLRRLERWRA